MRRFVRITVSAAIVIATLLVLYQAPLVRTKFDAVVAWWCEWTPEAQRRDPVGFSNHVEEELQKAKLQFDESRRELAGTIAHLSDTVERQQALYDYSIGLADRLRAAYRNALANDAFPFRFRGRAYTQSQAERQIKLIFSQAKGYHKAVTESQATLARGHDKLEELEVRHNDARTKLAAVPALREVIKAEVIANDIDKLVADLDRVAKQKHSAHLASGRSSPIRSVEQLIEEQDSAIDEPIAAGR